MTLEKSCKTCVECGDAEEFYYCEFHQTEIFNPEKGYCEEGYVNKQKTIEGYFRELLRDLEYGR